MGSPCYWFRAPNPDRCPQRARCPTTPWKTSGNDRTRHREAAVRTEDTVGWRDDIGNRERADPRSSSPVNVHISHDLVDGTPSLCLHLRSATAQLDARHAFNS